MTKYQILINAQKAFNESWRISRPEGNGYQRYTIEEYRLLAQHLLDTLKRFKMKPEFASLTVHDDPEWKTVLFMVNQDQYH
jgi:uncharacterized membrane protein